MSDLPTDLDTLLEAVEVMMGEEFSEALNKARVRDVLHTLREYT